MATNIGKKAVHVKVREPPIIIIRMESFQTAPPCEVLNSFILRCCNHRLGIIFTAHTLSALSQILGCLLLDLQWQGKTIALGTFPSVEAEEKCSRAKELTRSWRSTMRPKPTREWVIQELERLGVRVVSGGRSGQISGLSTDTAGGQYGGMLDNNNGLHSSSNSNSSSNMMMNLMTSSGLQIGNRDTAGLHPGSDMMGAAASAENGGGRWGDNLAVDAGGTGSRLPKRNSSLGLSLLMNAPMRETSFGSMASFGRNASLGGSAAAGQSAGLSNAMFGGARDRSDAGTPRFRQLVGGGAAAAFNAYRDDFYEQQRAERQRRASSLGLGASGTGNSSMPNNSNDGVGNQSGLGGSPGNNPNGSSIGVAGAQENPVGNMAYTREYVLCVYRHVLLTHAHSQNASFFLDLKTSHYEMLKLHHLNLLNEMQETTMIMNIYQQQQQQRQLEMLQQQQNQQQEGTSSLPQQTLLQQQQMSSNAGMDIRAQLQAYQQGSLNTQLSQSAITAAMHPGGPPINQLLQNGPSNQNQLLNGSTGQERHLNGTVVPGQEQTPDGSRQEGPPSNANKDTTPSVVSKDTTVQEGGGEKRPLNESLNEPNRKRRKQETANDETPKQN